MSFNNRNPKKNMTYKHANMTIPIYELQNIL